MVIQAKPVIANQFWILRQGDEKVGNIEATHEGFQVKINNQVRHFKTMRMVKANMGINFEPITKSHAPKETAVYGFDTGCRAYNAMYEVKRHLPLFTKTRKSKSWYAAGWYAVKQNNTWRVQHNPKLITLQRYPYRGPFHNAKDAQ
jgi:hypothetical protein